MKYLATALVVTILSMGLYAGDKKRAGDDVSAKGVASYEILRVSDNIIKLDLFDSDDLEVGSMTITRTHGRGALVQFVSPRSGAHFTLSWITEMPPRLEIRSERDLAVKEFDEKSKMWIDSGAVHLFDLHADAITLIGAVLAELESMESVDSVRSSNHQNQPTDLYETVGARITPCRAGTEVVANLVNDWPDPGDGGGSSTHCTGIWVRGFYTSITRSGACYGAKRDANTSCWNQYCTGCCELLDCDAFCAGSVLGGDYFCTASMSGRSCGPDPFL